MFKLQTKSGQKAKWVDHGQRTRFHTREDAESYARAWDQDGDFNVRATRIVELAQ